MASRASVILKMAQEKSKENLRNRPSTYKKRTQGMPLSERSVNKHIKIEDDRYRESISTENGIKKTKLYQWHVKDDLREPVIGDTLFLNTFFTPLCVNETQSSINGNLDLSIEHLKNAICKQQMQNENIIAEVNEDMDMDFSSDDSVKDPDFIVSETTTDTDSESEVDDNIKKMSIQIENAVVGVISTQHDVNNLETQKQTTSKKIIQVKRNNGMSYLNKRGKKIEERKCVQMDLCRFNCKDKIVYEDQKKVFNHYWSLGSYNNRLLYIASLIDIDEKGSQTLKKSNNPKNRQHTNFYYLEMNGEKIRVCQKCFMKCFGETPSFLRSVISKKQSAPITPLLDQRGISTPNNKFSDTKIKMIKNHIQSFPTCDSHYSRRDSSKKYLGSDLTIAKMHQLYCQQNANNIISLAKYSTIFNTMNLKFKLPQVDTCNKCDTLKAKLTYTDKNCNEYNTLLAEQSRHIEDSTLAYDAKKNDKLKAKSNSNIKMLTFDLQQVLPTPFVNTSVSFYKRQLYTYNLTIHDCVNNTPYCFMWHEAEGKRGTNEIASCVLRYLQENIACNKTIDTIILYSDSCSGQNKNSYIHTMFQLFIQEHIHIKSIEHKFLTPGHTHMECDVDHALIERKKKKTSTKIHHHRDWYQFVRSVGTKNLFQVIEMEHKHFVDFGTTAKEKYVWRKLNDDGVKFSWRDVKWFKYTHGNFGIIEYKTTLNESEPFQKMNIKKRGVNTVNLKDVMDVRSVPFISKEKKNDLLSLLDLIDPCFHEFYKSLKTGDNIPNIDPDIIEPDVDIAEEII